MTGNTTAKARSCRPNVLKATLQPAIGLPNTLAKTLDFGSLLNPGLRRGGQTAAYRGHLMTFHGGDLPGFPLSGFLHAERQASGVIVLVISDHSARSTRHQYNVYDGFLDMDKRPGASAGCNSGSPGRKAGTEARAKAGGRSRSKHKPSHALADYGR